MAINESGGGSAINSSAVSLANQPAPDEPTKPEVSALKTAPGSLGGPSVAQEQKTMLQSADVRIAKGAQFAGVTLPPTTTHVDRFMNAIAVYNKLVENGSYSNDPEIKGAADKFLSDMGKIGEKFGMNFGLSTAISKDDPKGVPLNQGKFAGIDFQKATERLQGETKAVLEKSKGTGNEPLWDNDGASGTAPVTLDKPLEPETVLVRPVIWDGVPSTKDQPAQA